MIELFFTLVLLCNIAVVVKLCFEECYLLAGIIGLLFIANQFGGAWSMLP